MRIAVKICGIMTSVAAAAAVEAGVDALGFVFADSPRRIDVGLACELAAKLPAFVTRVAVFHHPEPAHVENVVSGFAPDVVQSPRTLGEPARTGVRSNIPTNGIGFTHFQRMCDC